MSRALRKGPVGLDPPHPVLSRTHTTETTRSTAIYSPCERYRYALSRDWAAGPRLLYVMLNPSKATERANDPTIERCQRRATALGYGGFTVVNLFAWRETSPAALKRAADPVGPANDAQLIAAAQASDAILAAWGVHGAHRDRADAVARLLRGTGKPLLSLGVTKDGHPLHPLYVSYATPLSGWSPD